MAVSICSRKGRLPRPGARGQASAARGDWATAVAFNEDNPVALAKVLTAFAKANPNLVFKAGLVEGKPVAAAEIRAIAELPTREELVSRLLFLLQSPLRRLVTVLNGPVRNLAGVVKQIAEQKAKSEAGEVPPSE